MEEKERLNPGFYDLLCAFLMAKYTGDGADADKFFPSE
jgi:hypothetical protein